MRVYVYSPGCSGWGADVSCPVLYSEDDLPLWGNITYVIRNRFLLYYLSQMAVYGKFAWSGAGSKKQVWGQCLLSVWWENV